MKIEEVEQIVGGKLFKGKTTPLKKIKIDSRNIEKGDIFIALKGKNNDGNHYIKEAEKRKAGLIICEKKENVSVPMLLVEDTYKALWNLGKYYREKYDPLCIAITGSYGKTTTKELLYHIVKDHYKVLKSPKNYNNHIGVPLTLFELTENVEIVIIELGMNHKGEIENLSKLVKPDIGIITAIGTSHIGYLKGKKNIYKAKMEITKGMKDGILLVNGDDTYLRKVKNHIDYDVIKCGKHSTYHLIPYQTEETLDHLSFYIKYQNKEYKVETNFIGAHFIEDILIGIETALLLNIELEDILSSIKTFKMKNQRMEITNYKSFTVINDSYNASYESVKALLSFVQRQKLDAYLILGDMLELGSYSKKYHKKIGKILKKIKHKKAILIGEEMRVIKGKNIYHFSSNEEGISYLEKEDLEGKTVLLKGARAMHLEKVADYLKQKGKN